MSRSEKSNNLSINPLPPLPQISRVKGQMHSNKVPLQNMDLLGDSSANSKSNNASDVTTYQDMFEALSWDKYFQRKHEIVSSQGRFCVYTSGTCGPVLLFLHGAGFCGLTWSLVVHELTRRIDCQCVAYDCRGHGDTHTSNEDDLSCETLAKDAEVVYEELVAAQPPLISPDAHVILVGHSMGGAIVTRVAYEKGIPATVGLVVIDVVEGSAMQALSQMNKVLKQRPKNFASLSAGIKWAHTSGTIRNAESARVSFPGQLKSVGRTDQEPASALDAVAADDGVTGDDRSRGCVSTAAAVPPGTDTIAEEQGEEAAADDPGVKVARPPRWPGTSSSAAQQQQPPAAFTWRIDLSRTQPHWAGWFSGLSHMFLAAPAAKLLLLAGVDRLDKDLLIGQMQGKFQMHAFQKSGHTVHEDEPELVADKLKSFLVRNKFATER